MLFSSRGQGNFRGLEASRPRPKTLKSVLGDVLKAKDVLEDSTSVIFFSVPPIRTKIFCFTTLFAREKHKIISDNVCLHIVSDSNGNTVFHFQLTPFCESVIDQIYVYYSLLMSLFDLKKPHWCYCSKVLYEGIT